MPGVERGFSPPLLRSMSSYRLSVSYTREGGEGGREGGRKGGREGGREGEKANEICYTRESQWRS